MAGCQFRSASWELTLEERNHLNETLVAGLTVPARHDDGVVGLEVGVLGVDVEHYDLAGVTVQVVDVLDDLTVDVAGVLTEELVRKVEGHGVELLGDGETSLT